MQPAGDHVGWHAPLTSYNDRKGQVGNATPNLCVPVAMLSLAFIPITVTTACSNHGDDVPMTMHTPPPAPAGSRHTRKGRPHEVERVTTSGTTW